MALMLTHWPTQSTQRSIYIVKTSSLALAANGPAIIGCETCECVSDPDHEPANRSAHFSVFMFLSLSNANPAFFLCHKPHTNIMSETCLI